MKFWAWTKHAKARKVFSWSRWLHVYLSTALLALLLFFCVTGVTLNHPSWFTGKDHYQSETSMLPIKLLEKLSDPNPPVQEITQYIGQTFQLRDPRKVDMDLELGEWMFDYPLPGGFATVLIDVNNGEVVVESQRGTLVSLLNDLHKGRNSGGGWSILIDVSAILIGLLSLTGLMILLQMTRWRTWGLILAGFGLIAPFILYFLCVPQSPL